MGSALRVLFKGGFLMAAYKAKHEERARRRALMLDMRKRGLSYEVIGRMFGVSKQTARTILLLVYKQMGVTDVKGISKC